MKHSRLQSILTAAIVDYCQTNDLYIAELHIQGTVCISSDGAPTLVTQLSEKVSTNNNRWVVGGGHVRKSPPPQQILDHRPDAEELALLRYEHSKSPLRKHRRKSDPGNRHHPKYSNEFHRDVQGFRWSVDSIPENTQLKYATPREEAGRSPIGPPLTYPQHTESPGYTYKTPKEEPSDSGLKQQHAAHTSESVHSELTENRAHSASSSSSRPDAETQEVAARWQHQQHQHREQAVSAAALAVYNYMHSPSTYHHHPAGDLRAGVSSSAHDLRSDPVPPLRSGKDTSRVLHRDEVQSHHNQQVEAQEQQQQHQRQVPGSSGSLNSVAPAPSSAIASGNHLSSPPPPPQTPPRSTPGIPRSPVNPPSPHHPQTTLHHHPHLRGATYQAYRPPSLALPQTTRDLAPLPLDYTSHCGPGLTSPIKAEAREELHVVTRSLGPHVPSMVSPSAQAAASAMAALSSLQASIMPTGPPPHLTSKTSPESNAGTSISSLSQGDAERDSSPLAEVEPEPDPSPSPESPISDPGGMEVPGMTAAGCLQIPDAPVNSHFRKMMLKSLQGKYKVLKTAEGRYKCPVCGVSYVYQPNLRKHLEKVHLGKSYKCEFCGQKFTSVQGYSFHRKVKHRDLMPYRCELCRDAFYSYTAFLQHKKRSHSNHPECVAITHDQNLQNARAAAASGSANEEDKTV